MAKGATPGAGPLFDAYVMVDWSAASVARRGKDSIWIGLVERTGGDGELRLASLVNPPTRIEAEAWLRAELARRLAGGGSVLVGFDFPFGYPRGLADRLALWADGRDRPPWRALWDEIAGLVEDDETNANNRFAVAAGLNQRISGGAFPFWACPPAAGGTYLATTHHRRHDSAGLPEHRRADRVISGPQPVWKLAGIGSVGGQALTGIPVVQRLRDDPALASLTRVWPFETGLKPLGPPGRRGRVVLAEVYPSILPARPVGDEPKDAAQVRGLARHFARLDGAGRLASLFAGDPELGRLERRVVEREEGWILGVVGSASRRYAYLREPNDIYRRSFEMIGAETDLTHVPPDLRALVRRLVHAVGDPSIVGDLAWSDGAGAAARQALLDGAPILVDAEMVAHGIIRRRLPAGNEVACTLGDRRVSALARRHGTTRSAAAVELWRERLDGAVVAIGNAPTALFHLLEIIAAGAPLPAAILGFPVGFVGAAESKAALAEHGWGIPFVTLHGRRGGSALAAAAVNALAGDGEAA